MARIAGSPHSNLIKKQHDRRFHATSVASFKKKGKCHCSRTPPPQPPRTPVAASYWTIYVSCFHALEWACTGNQSLWKNNSGAFKAQPWNMEQERRVGGAGCNEGAVIGTRFWPPNASASASTALWALALPQIKPNRQAKQNKAGTRKCKWSLTGWDKAQWKRGGKEGERRRRGCTLYLCWGGL